MRSRVLTIMLSAGLIVSGCSKNPVTGQKELTLIGAKQEVAMGEQQYVALQQASGGPFIAEPELVAYVERVGKKLAQVSDRPDLPYEFVVVNNKVPNAWALPGGKIAVHRGLLTELENEAELAAVLGHEIVHVAARHGAKNVERGVLYQAGLVTIASATQDTQYGDLVLGGAAASVHLVTMKYGRNMELEADHYGIEYMVRAGYDPEAAVTLQEKFVRLANGKQPGWLEGLLASHPASQERVARNREIVDRYEPGGFLGAEEYDKELANLVAAQDAYDAYDKGREALKNGDTKSALYHAEMARRLFPNEALFYGLAGDIRLAEDKFPEAIHHYENAIRRNSDYFYYHLQRGLAYQKLGNPNMARSDLLQSLKLLPTTEAHTALAKIELSRNNDKAAIEHLRNATEADPVNNREALLLLTRTEMQVEPHKYFTITNARDDNGYVKLVVENQSVVAAEGVVLKLTVRDPAGRVKTQREMRIPKQLPSGYKATLDTDIAVSAGDGSVVQAQVMQAQPL